MACATVGRIIDTLSTTLSPTGKDDTFFFSLRMEP